MEGFLLIRFGQSFRYSNSEILELLWNGDLDILPDLGSDHLNYYSGLAEAR